mgnify:CR=1 FL=1
MSASIALPLLEAMVPAFTATAHTAASPPTSSRVHLRAARRDHEAVDASRRKGRVRAHADHEAARAVPESPGCRQQPRQARSRIRYQSRRSTRRRSSPGCRRSAPMVPTSQLGVTLDQVVGETDRTGHDVPLARSRDRRLLRTGRVCAPGYSCAYANTLELAGDRRRHYRWRSTHACCSSACSVAEITPRSGPRVCARIEQHPGFRERRSPTDLGGRIGPGDRARLERVTSITSGSRAADSAGGAAIRCFPRRSRSAGRRAGQVRGPRWRCSSIYWRWRIEADLTRVFIVHDGPRAQSANVSEHRRDVAASRHLAPRQQPGTCSGTRHTSTPTTSALFARFLERLRTYAGRRRVAAGSLNDSAAAGWATATSTPPIRCHSSSSAPPTRSGIGTWWRSRIHRMRICCSAWQTSSAWPWTRSG